MYETVGELVYDLINEVGLSISAEQTLVDQDSFKPLFSGGKQIKCSIDDSNPVYKSEFYIAFDPINDMKLMTTMLSYYLEKERIINDLYVITYCFVEDTSVKGAKVVPSRLVAKIQEGKDGKIQTIETNYYNNRCLKISDFILRMGGYDADLSNFDTIEE